MRAILAAIFCVFLSACAPKPAFAKAVACTDRYCSDWGAKPQRQSVAKRVRHKIVRHRTIKTYARRPARYDASLRRSSAGLVAPLKAKAETILAACPGAFIMSAVRNTRVRGSGRISLHATGRAVDMAGNEPCIRRQLAGWAGGASRDYYRVRPNHYHISWGGSEHGKRFVHWQPRARRVRLAHAHR